MSLLVRSTRRVELTPAGAAFLIGAVAIFGAVDDAARQVQRIAEGAEGRRAIGCVGSATYSLLPRLAGALREELRAVDVGVRGETLAPAEIAALLAGESDSARLRPPIEQSGLLVETVRRDRLLVALPDGLPLAA